MEVKLGFELVLSGLKFLLGSIKWMVKKVSSRTWKALSTVALALMVSVAASIITTNILTPSRPDPTPSLLRETGLDLQRYCVSYKYDGVNMDRSTGDAFCSSTVGLDDACDWQYSRTGLKLILADPDNPMTGGCRDDQNRLLGGISDMSGYCNHLRPGSPSAIAIGKTWTCRLKVDMNVACDLQYNRSNEVARFEDGEWVCYRQTAGTTMP